MATIEGIDTDSMELADALAEHLGSTPPRVVKMALALLAVDCGVRLELPKKENEHAE